MDPQNEEARDLARQAGIDPDAPLDDESAPPPGEEDEGSEETGY
jgi:hypothetical protein